MTGKQKKTQEKWLKFQWNIQVCCCSKVDQNVSTLRLNLENKGELVLLFKINFTVGNETEQPQMVWFVSVKEVVEAFGTWGWTGSPCCPCWRSAGSAAERAWSPGVSPPVRLLSAVCLHQRSLWPEVKGHIPPLLTTGESEVYVLISTVFHWTEWRQTAWWPAPCKSLHTPGPVHI